MQNSQPVRARANGRNEKNFISLAQTILDMVADEEVGPAAAVEALTDLFYSSAISDPQGWREPPEKMALNPIVFSALQMARWKIPFKDSK